MKLKMFLKRLLFMNKKKKKGNRKIRNEKESALRDGDFNIQSVLKNIDFGCYYLNIDHKLY